MKVVLRSKKKRLVKKHFKKTGNLPAILIGKKGGLYWYKVSAPVGMVIFADSAPLIKACNSV